MVTLCKAFFLLCCSAIFFPSSAIPDVYRKILPDGTPVFTDRPTDRRYSLVIMSWLQKPVRTVDGCSKYLSLRLLSLKDGFYQ